MLFDYFNIGAGCNPTMTFISTTIREYLIEFDIQVSTPILHSLDQILKPFPLHPKIVLAGSFNTTIRKCATRLLGVLQCGQLELDHLQLGLDSANLT